MSLEEQDKLEDRQQSFSFSNYDFSSSSSGIILSDGEDSDKSYIEIELERAKSYRTGGDVQSDGEDGEIELRISISSHTPFPQLSIPSFSHVTDAAENNVACSNEEQDKKTEMPCTRTPSSKTRMTMQGGILKFFIKLRAMQAKALLAPIMNTRHASATATDPKGKKRTSGRERKQKLEETLGFYGRMSTSKSAKNSLAAVSSSAGRDQYHSKSSSVNNKKCTADALNGERFERTSLSTSCPSSIRCSPLHARENSIQAAIAHCKSSFAPFPGFYF